MHVCNLPRWDVAALIGGRDFRIYTIERDTQLEDFLVGAVGRFWSDHVVAKVPPAGDAASYRDYLAQKWQRVTGDYIKSDMTADAVIAECLANREGVATYERLLQSNENVLREIIGDAPGIDCALGRIHCKPYQRRVTQWEQLARHLAAEYAVPGDVFALLIDGYTKDSKASRPLRYPARKKAEGWDECSEVADRGMAGLKKKLASGWGGPRGLR